MNTKLPRRKLNRLYNDDRRTPADVDEAEQEYLLDEPEYVIDDESQKTSGGIR